MNWENTFRPRNEDRDERTYDELLDQLHRLVQEGSRIQPAAWRAARARVAEEPGPKIFNGLRAEDSRHFLLTAEVFLAASRDVAAMMDAAPIAVEYAKAVEGAQEAISCRVGSLSGESSKRTRSHTLWQPIH